MNRHKWRRYPRTLIYFEAFVLREKDDPFGDEGDERCAYGGVIDPVAMPCTQADYERQAKTQLDHYRSLDRVVRIETRRYFWDGQVRQTFRRRKS